MTPPPPLAGLILGYVFVLPTLLVTLTLLVGYRPAAVSDFFSGLFG